MTRIGFVFAALAFAGLALTTLALLSAWIFRWKRRPFGLSLPEARTLRGAFRQADSDLPIVSILKPVAGVDDGFAQNLAKLAAFSGSDHEIIVSIASESDPAVAVVRTVMDAHPNAPLKLVIGGRRRAANPKVERLIEAAAHARGTILMISDAQVDITEEQLTRTLTRFRDPSVGVVSNLFIGEGARSFGAWIECTHLLTFVAAGNTLAAVANVPCLVGKSMAIPRTVLERIGGFESFAHVLAEDQAIALAVRRAGYRVALSPVVVTNRVERKSLAAALARQIRWNKIRYAFSPAAYSAELIMHPVSWSLLASATALMQPGADAAFHAFFALMVLARMAQGAALALIFGHQSVGTLALLTPIQDVLQFAAQFVPFFSNRVNWRGHQARIGRGTVIIPLRSAAATGNGS